MNFFADLPHTTTLSGAVSGAEIAAMEEARRCARDVVGTTSPNPAVGAVIVSDEGQIVGRGATQPPGGAHAEVMALHAAGKAADGATAVVTLEPCNHTGRTGPCAQALIAAGIRRVVIACADPTDNASGGADTLRRAGITVVTGLHAREAADEALRPWLWTHHHGRPHITLKVAATLDGYITSAGGQSQWITGPEARADVHCDRARRDAIIVGTSTAIIDNPQLTARTPDGTLYSHQPYRIVMGERALPADARIRGDDGRFHHVGRDFDKLFALLTSLGCTDVLLEGGAQLASQFVARGYIDALRWYVAPTLLGAGSNAIAECGITDLADRRDFRITQHNQLGKDLLVTALRDLS